MNSDSYKIAMDIATGNLDMECVIDDDEFSDEIDVSPLIFSKW